MTHDSGHRLRELLATEEPLRARVQRAGSHPFRLALSVGTAVMDAAGGKRIEDLR